VRLTTDLAALGAEPHFAVDVTQRVMSSLADARPGRADVPAGQLGWAAAAAVAGGLAILAGLWPLLPDLYRIAGEGWAMASGLRLVVTQMVLLGGSVLSAAITALARVADGLAPLVSLLQGLQPIALGALTACVLIMTSTIVLVVGRDLRGVTCSRGTSR
jgi:hypothetical protein